MFAEQGATATASAVLDVVMTDACGIGANGANAPRLPVVHPLARTATSIDGAHLVVDGVSLSSAEFSTDMLVASPDDETVILRVPRPQPHETAAVSGFDPSSKFHHIQFRVPIAEAEDMGADWRIARAAGRRALAGELVGNGRAMLGIAVDQVSHREQFGRAIGANQTPRHRLADSYVHLAAANELVDAAWSSQNEWDAIVAKTYAGYANELTASACLQVCGAIGLTSEHRLGGYVKRARMLDALYGGWHRSIQRIGMDLTASGSLPQGASA
ncbi:acyl-CoA dehydrogenase family protein [Gordonia insulae]|uniref:acyl-CoA dehydrogenase family protein n=1 Tax=Gordonia insulae TaxID=2420509 RepID=UPI001E30F5D8|nr:acyl-CoA dehydrogenase family protein [Gordonia insulae]